MAASFATTNATTNTINTFPPGVLQSFTMEDPVYWGNHSEVEITLLPSSTFAPSLSDSEAVFSGEDVAIISELMEAAEQENDKIIGEKMDAIQAHIDRFDKMANESWDFNSGPAKKFPWLWVNQEGAYDSSDCGWISYMEIPYFRNEYVAYVDYEVAEVLEMAEEDADYEAWLTSKQYVKSLQKYNMHKLLAWDKESGEENPKWSGECAGDIATNVNRTILYDTLFKERYRVEVYVHTLNWANGKYYAFGTTPYGDVYIPQKIANYLKDNVGLYEMDIALQDVEGAPGKKPNSFRWTCVYLHNNGFSL
jgi:hypothetical protein